MPTSEKIIRFLLIPSSIFAVIALAGCGEKTGESPHLDPRDANDLSAAEKTHAEHQALKDHVAHRGIVLLDTVYKTKPATRHQMARLLEFYGMLREALFAGDETEADKAAANMSASAEDVPPQDFRNVGKEAWEQHAKLYGRTLAELQHVPMEKKRSYFAHISEIVYCTVKSFGLGSKLPNVYFCPMAFKEKGAYWLSESDAVRNPYFGSAMPACGDLVETLGP
jgi:hypothetical protein